MPNIFSGVSSRTFALTTGCVSLGLFTSSYFAGVPWNWRHQGVSSARSSTSPDTTKIPQNQTAKMTVESRVKTPYQALFAVHMTCDSCVKSVSETLYGLGGITKVEANLKDQLVAVEGTAAPSAIVSAIEATGRDAILRGSGATNSAAVAILEIYHHGADTGTGEKDVRGLARMVQVSPTMTLVDLTVKGVLPGRYYASIREYGDLKDGAASTGPVWASNGDGSPAAEPRGALGALDIDEKGRGAVFLDHPFQVWEVIGHAFVVSKQVDQKGASLKSDDNTVLGIIARSAGMWDNDKTVCSCSGKTLWEERKDEVAKGMF